MNIRKKRVYLYESSDVHSHIYEDGTDYGMARIASFVKEKRQKQENIVLLDNGDYLQGTPLASFMALRHEPPSPKPLIEVLNLIGYDYFNLGNHEFNFGQSYLKEAEKLFQGQMLCANCVTQGDEVAFGKPYAIVEKAGIKIGILGLITDYVPHWERPEHIKGLTFLDPVEVAKKWAKIIKKETDLLIVAYHGGPEKDFVTGEQIGLGNLEHDALKLIDEVPEIDAILCGHQHRAFAEVYKGVPLISPSWRGNLMAELVCDFEVSDGQVTLKHIEPNLIKMSDYPPDEEIKAYLMPWLSKVDEWLDKPLGYTTNTMQIRDVVRACSFNHPYLDLVNTIQLESTGADLSATSLFGIGVTGLCSQVKVRHIVSNYMYSNSLKVLKITGKDLRAALEKCAEVFTILDGQLGMSTSKEGRFVALYNYDVYKGIRYSFDITKPKGKRVVRLNYQGKEVLETDTFTLALNNYRAVGGGGYEMYDESKIIKTIEQDVVDLMISYIQKKSILPSYEENAFMVVGYENEAN